MAEQIDLLFRAGAGVTLLLTAALWLRRTPCDRTAQAFALTALGAAGFLAGNAADPVLRMEGGVGAVAHILSGWAAVFVWWFVLRLFGAEGPSDARVLGASLVWMAYAAAERGALGVGLQMLPSWPLLLAGLGILVHLCVTLVRERDQDLIEARRALRLGLAGGLAALLAADLLIDIVMGVAWRPAGLALFQNAALLLLALFLADAVLTARSPFAAPAPALARTASTPAEAPDPDAVLLRRLDTLLAESVHLDPGLTIAGLARRLAASEARTRRLINHRLGHGHFRTFLNAHRVAAAKTRLADPACAAEPITEVALLSGFASLASFNRAFRAVTKETPSAYRARALGRGGRAPSEEVPSGC